MTIQTPYVGIPEQSAALSSDNLTAAALAYASKGIPVFPVSETKKPLVRWKDGATTDANVILDWWRQWPRAMIGVPTGARSGLMVLDVDCKNGVDGLANLLAAGVDPFTLTPVVVGTPSGGRHFYMQTAGQLGNSVGQLAEGVDVRGDGGFIIVPPSLPDVIGKPYKWEGASFMDASVLPQWPAQLQELEKVCRTAKSQFQSDYGSVSLSDRTGKRGRQWALAALDDETTKVASTPPGERNTALNTAALKLGHKVAGGHLTESEVTSALMDAAQASGLIQDDGANSAYATIRSGLNKGLQEAQHPVDLPKLRLVHGGSFQPEPERTSRFYSAATLAGKPVPEREWMVNGLVPMSTVTLFSGDGGTGKSLLALQMAVAATAGTGWLGQAVRRGRVIFLSAEDDDAELHRRLDTILRREARSYADAAGLTLRSLAGEDALLAVETQVRLLETALFEELDARAEEDAPAMIVIDTLADVYPANENDRAKVRQFIGILRGLALRHACSVILLGHPSLTGLGSGTGTSGSTAWNNSVRSRLYLSRIVQDGYEPDPDKRMLATKKANYGRVGGKIAMTWHDGVFVADASPTGLDRLASGAKAERLFLTLLDERATQGRRVNASGGTAYAPKVFAEHPSSEGVTKHAFRAAMEGLLSAGRIVNDQEGPPSRRVSFLARAGQ